MEDLISSVEQVLERLKLATDGLSVTDAALLEKVLERTDLHPALFQRLAERGLLKKFTVIRYACVRSPLIPESTLTDVR